MVFQPVAIFDQDVPPNSDTLTYYVSKPNSKQQEQAQAQAKALGLTLRQGLSHADIERLFPIKSKTLPPPATEQQPEMTKELIQTIQESKETNFSSKITPEHIFKVSLPYPFMYLYPFSKLSERYRKKIFKIDAAEDPPASKNIIKIGPDDVYDPVVYLMTLQTEVQQLGILKLEFQGKTNLQIKVPSGAEHIIFKTERQVAVNSEFTYSYDEMRSMFFNALLKFHQLRNPNITKLKFPLVNNRAVDLYKLFRVVERFEGPNAVSFSKEWTKVAKIVGINSSLAVRYIYPKFLADFREWLNSKYELKPNNLVVLNTSMNSQPFWDLLDENLDIWIYKFPAASATSDAHKYIVINDDYYDPPMYNIKNFGTKNYLDTELQLGYETECTLSNEHFLIKHEYLRSEVFESSIWDLMRLAVDSSSCLNSINQSADKYLFPKLEAGLTNSQRMFRRSIGKTYELNLLFEGGYRIWKLKNGVEIKQYPGDIVFVHPDYESSFINKGYCVGAYINLGFWNEWPYRVLFDREVNKEVCMQKVVYDWHSQHVPQNLGKLKQMLYSKEVEYNERLQNLPRLRDHNDDVKVCQKTGKLLYFSWVDCNGKVISCDEFVGASGHASGDSDTSGNTNTTGAKLVTRYDSVDSFFTTWDTPKPEPNIISRLSKPGIRTESQIKQLITDMPMNTATYSDISNLSKILSNLNVDLNLNELNKPLDCIDDAKHALELVDRVNMECDQLDAKYIAALVKPDDPENLEIVKEFDTIKKWLLEVKEIETKQTSYYYLNLLFMRGVELDVPKESVPFQVLVDLRNNMETYVEFLNAVFESPEDINPMELSKCYSFLTAHLDCGQDKRTVVRLQLLGTVMNLFVRLYDVNVLNRPKNSEVKPYRTFFPLFNRYMLEMESWLMDVQYLNWPEITARITSMYQMIERGGDLISISRIERVCVKFTELRIITDDAAFVYNVFTTALNTLRSTDPQLLLHYGFTN